EGRIEPCRFTGDSHLGGQCQRESPACCWAVDRRDEWLRQTMHLYNHVADTPLEAESRARRTQGAVGPLAPARFAWPIFLEVESSAECAARALYNHYPRPLVRT